MSFTITPATRQGIKKPSIIGCLNPHWKGGKSIAHDGRVLIFSPDHPRPSKGRYVYRYRLVVEESLGRFLEPHEVVHHKNGLVYDDRLENLEMMPRDQHNRLHAHDLLMRGKWARKHDKCVCCATIERPHKGRGLCSTCFEKSRLPRGVK